jgi:hypothetical protein
MRQFASRLLAYRLPFERLKPSHRRRRAGAATRVPIKLTPLRHDQKSDTGGLPFELRKDQICHAGPLASSPDESASTGKQSRSRQRGRDKGVVNEF